MNESESLTEIITDDFSKSLGNELISPSSNIAMDVGEIALDNLIKNDFLKEIPILSIASSAFKIVGGVKDLFFLKKLAIFLQEYHSNQIEPEKVLEFNSKLKNDKTYRQKVIEHIIVCVDRLENITKAKILAKLLLGHTKGNYDWNYFVDLVASLNIIHPKGISILNNNKDTMKPVDFIIIYEPLETTIKQEINLQKDIESIAMLESVGLIFKGHVSPPRKSDVVSQETTMLTDLGYKFIKYGLS